MKFDSPLIRATLVRRYKRFLCDALLEDGTLAVAHCANPGAMLGLLEPGAEIWLSKAREGRKLAFSWELLRFGDRLVGINTALPNLLAAEAIARQSIPELSGYATMRREVPYGINSRIDLLLEGPDRPKCYIEVKNVHLRRIDDQGRAAAQFPDSVTIRGAKHLAELAAAARQGARAVMLYLVQREDCDYFSLAADIDPVYAAAFGAARDAGVEALCYQCRLTIDGIEVASPLKVET